MSKISLSMQAQEVELAAMGKRAQIGAREEANRKAAGTWAPEIMARDKQVEAALTAASRTLSLFVKVEGTEEMAALRARMAEILRGEKNVSGD